MQTDSQSTSFKDESIDKFDLSIVVALVNHGGHWEESIRSWTKEQDYPRDRYEVIVVSNGKRACEAGVKKLLYTQDSLLTCDLTAELDIYDFGIRAAHGKYVFLAEAHSVGLPDCLTEMMKYLVETGKPGAMCQSYGAWKSYVGEMQELVFQQENAEFAEGDHWHRIALRGTAIRKSVYFEYGGFAGKYSMFGDRWFDIVLFSQNVRLGFAHKSVVKHWNVSGYAHLESAVQLFTYGECEFRDDYSEDFCKPYIGISIPWRERFSYDPTLSQLRLSALKQIFTNRVRQPRLWKSAISTIPFLIEAQIYKTFGVRLNRMSKHGIAQCKKLATWFFYALKMMKLAKISFQKYFQLSLVDYFRYDYIEKTRPAIKCASRLTFPMDRDLGDHLIGFHPVETKENGEHFRWTAPVAIINTKLPVGDYVIELEDANCRPLIHPPHLTLFFNNTELQRIPSEAGSNVLSFRVEWKHFIDSEIQHILLISDCFIPSKHGSKDARRLGVPLSRIELHPLLSTAKASAPVLSVQFPK